MPMPPTLGRLTALSATLMLAGPALADVIVGTTQDLEVTLNEADPGETVRLKPGRYEGVSIRRIEGAEGRPITVTSADPSDRARISDMHLHEAAHVVLDDLIFDYKFSADDNIHLRSFKITDGRDIVVRNSLFDGDVAQGVSENSDGFAYTFGLGVRNVDGLTIENNEIHTFFRGLVVSDSKNVLVKGNNVHSLRMDGMNFSQIDNIRIEKNYIHDFDRSPDTRDHADMIQFWTNRTNKPTQNVTIRDNILNSEDGLFTQSIFMRNDLVDRGLAGKEMFYQNILIENNVIINAHLHGILVGEANEVQIKGNSVIRNAKSEGQRKNYSLYNPRISVSEKSTNVQIVNNVVSRISGFNRQNGWEAHGNFLIQDQHQLQPGYYGNVFANALEGDPKELSSFMPKVGGPLDGNKYGSSFLQH